MAASLYNAEVLFEYDVKWKLDTLLNEPLRNLSIRWRFPITGKIVGEDLTSFKGYQQSFPISDLPPHILETIRIYDVKVRITLARPGVGKEATVTFDAGVPDKAGPNWSYNVTGSPSWNKLMKSIGTHQPFTEDSAKTLMSAKKLEGRSGETMTAKVRLGEALRWLKRKSDKEPLRRMLKGAKEHLYVLNSTLGLPTENMELEFKYLEDQLDWAGTIPALDKVREQLVVAFENLEKGVPKRYVVPKLEHQYLVQRTKISKWVEQQLAELNQSLNDYKKSTHVYRQWEEAKRAELAASEANLNSLYARLKVIPAQDKGSALWGYKYEHNGEWAIPAKFLFANGFNDEGLARVGVDRKVETTKVRKNNLCSKKWRYVTVRKIYLKHATIDIKGKQVGATSSWYQPRSRSSGFKLTAKCRK